MPLSTPKGNKNPTYSLVGFLLPDNMPDVRETITGLLLNALDDTFWQQSETGLTVSETISIFTTIFDSWIDNP